MIGASAGAIAVFVFLTSHMPSYTFRLIIFDVKIVYIALIIIIMDLIQIPVSNAGGHLAHLGGAAWGFYYNNQLKKGNDLGKWVINLLNYLKRFLKKKVKKNIPNATYNLGSANPPIVNDLLMALINQAKSRSVLLPLPARLVKGVLGIFDFIGIPLMYPEQYLIADIEYRVDISNVMEDLNWQPEYSDIDMMSQSFEEFNQSSLPD